MALLTAPPSMTVGSVFRSPFTGTSYTVDSSGLISVTSQTDYLAALAIGFTAVWGGRNNFVATVDPAVGNDNTQDYQPGSLWLNATASPARWWIATSVATGAAVWVQISIGALIGSANSPSINNLTLAGLTTDSVAAAVTAFSGGGQGSATSLTATINNVTTSAAGSSPYDSVKFSATASGTQQVVYNNSANPIQLFGTGSITVNGFGATVGVTIPVGGIFGARLNGTNWQGTLLGMGFTTNEVANSNSATSGTTLTGANISGAINGVTLKMTGTMGGDANAQLPTVGNLVSAIPNAVAGYSYRLRVLNRSSANHVWTITTNTGWTLTGTMTIAQNTWRDFVLTLTTTSAAVLEAVGTGTDS